jgi:hypothetical protein
MALRNSFGAALLCAAVQACGGGDATETESPVATVRHFLEVMDRSAADEAALKEAYRLLDAAARQALADRAERATTLAGRGFEPWQMLAQGRFRLRFAPASPRGMRERVQGDRAVVTVTGAQPGQHAEVPLVLEHGRWRIALPVPTMRSEPRSPEPQRPSPG